MSMKLIRALVLVLLLSGVMVYGHTAGYVNVIDLSGDWSVQTEDSSTYEIRIPVSLESQVAELRSYSGTAVYHKEFPIPEVWKGRQIILKFGAVDWLADVSVNGTSVGSHEGGYTPFQFDVTEHVKIGEWNDLEVAVTDVAPGESIGTLVFDEIPHGRQAWHGPQSGIWQNVTIEAVEPVTVSKVRITPDIDRSVVVVDVSLTRPSDSGELRLIVLGEGAIAHTTTIPLKPDEEEYSAEIRLDSPKLWEPEEPYLYRLQTRIRLGDNQTDAEQVEFGMRKIEVKDNRIYLNNRPLFVRGVFDQDYYPLTGYTVPSDEILRTQFQRAKHMGINLIRCQSKVPDPRYLRWTDRVGLIVWYEMPAFGKLSSRSQTRARLLLTEALERDYNHPSLCIVSLMGEGWGVDPANAEHRAWQKVMYENAKTLDPTRLIIDGSVGNMYHMKTDIRDLSHKIPLTGEPQDYATWISDVVKTPGASFSPLGDSERRGWEPLIISDPGNWGLPKITSLRKTYDGDPWWFESGSDASKAAGVEQRFKDQGLDRVFGTMDALAEACQWHQWESLKCRIEELRRHPEISGYVLSEFADVNWEADGLLDSSRNPKVFYDKVRCVQAPDVVMADSRDRSYWSGRATSIDVLVSHMSQISLQDCRVRWHLEGADLRGEITGVSVADMDAAKVGTINLTMPSVDRPMRTRLIMSLVSASGQVITENYHEISIHPVPRPEQVAPIVIWDPAGTLGDLRTRMSSAGYAVSGAPAQSAVLLADQLDDEVRSFLHQGGRVILVAARTDSIPRLANSSLAVVSGDANGQQSDRSKCFVWARSADLMRNIALDPGAGSRISGIQPKTVLVGLDTAKHPEDTFGGIFSGWLHSPAAVSTQFRAGSGRVFVTTLDLLSAYGDDPAATALLHDIAAYVSGKEFAPSTTVDLTPE